MTRSLRSLLILLAVLLPHYAWANEFRYVSSAVADVRKDPNPASEQVTQGLLWEKVEVLAESGGWAKVMMTEQYRTMKGYPGWIRVSDIRKSERPAKLWMVTAAKVGLRESADAKSKLVQMAYLGSKLPDAAGETAGDWVSVLLPGQTKPVFASRKSLQECSQIVRPSEGEALVETAKQEQGVPYLWGGMSNKGIDCSGLTWATYRRHGYAIPRDADQQFEFGVEADPTQLVAGDLLFFGKAKDYITHVGMYIGDGKFIHASSSLGGVTISEFALPRFQSNFQGARRILK
jgi:gamma-D-glutamyl-L-lysine dipeptidyl-peptidase